MNSFQEFLNVYASLLGQGIADTLAMLLISTFFAYIIGLFLGIILYVTEPAGLRPHKALNAVFGWIINMGRSIPFIILLVAVMPMTRTLVGTTTGVRGVIPPRPFDRTLRRPHGPAVAHRGPEGCHRGSRVLRRLGTTHRRLCASA